jgi:signal peptidase I
MNPKIKKSLLALFWSILAPGLGHVYLGKIKRAVIIFICTLIIQGPQFYYLIYPNNNGPLELLKILFGILYIYSAIDAFRISNRTEGSTYWKRCLAVYLLLLFIAFGMAIYIRTFYYQPFKVPSAAMSPTIIVGDQVMVNKSIYKTEDPQRGDIVIFIYPKEPSKNFIKRIVGLPNEALEIKDGTILINGIPVTQPEVFKKLFYLNRGDYGAEGQVVHIPPGYVYVLGDNSGSSYDSRYWGFIPRGNILGKAYKIFAPDSRTGPI